MTTVKVSPPDLHKPKREIDYMTREIARRAGRIMRDAIREQIPSGNGIVGVWPSCMATGALRSAVVAQEPVKRGDKWHLRVGVQARRKAAKYARIHEIGGEITPVSASRMVFTIPANCVRNLPQSRKKRKRRGGKNHGNIVIPQSDGSLLVIATHVRIKPKRYFEKGWAIGRQRIRARLGEIAKGHAIR